MDLAAPRLAKVLGSIAVAAGLAFSAPAQAELVYEVHVGNRPADADRYMGPLRDAMRELGVGGPHEIASNFIAVPRPSVIDAKVAAAYIVDQIELGYRAVLQGRDFKAASQTLASALRLAHENPGVFLGDANLRTEITRALVALGVSLNRTGELAGAKEAFTDLSRMLGAQPLRGYGREAERLYDAVNTGLAKGPRGRLSISVSPSDAQVYVNDEGTSRGNRFSAEMIPGRHRFVVAMRDRSLSYEVNVDPNKETALELDWEFEQSLVVSESWVGFRLRTPLDRARSLAFAKSFLSRSSRIERDTTAIALRLDKVCGRPALVGVRYNFVAKSQQVSGTVLLGKQDELKLRTLARFLVRDQTSPEVFTGDQEIPCTGVARAPASDAAPAPASTDSESEPSDNVIERRSGGPKWPAYVSGVLGLGAIGLGAYMIYLDGKGTCPGDPLDCGDNYKTATVGWATGATGAALVGFAVIWYVTHRGSSSTSVAVSPTNGGATAVVMARF